MILKELTVRTTVYAIISSGGITLHGELEARNVIMERQEIREILLRRPSRTGPIRDIAPQAPRIPLERIIRRHGDDAFHSQQRLDGPEIHRHIPERALVNAATSVPGRDAVPRAAGGAAVRRVHAVAAHAPVAPVEDLGVQRVVRRRRPVPVGEGALVAALADEGLLVVPREGAVPRQEICRIVDRLRLVDVDGDEVVVPRFGPRGESWVGEGGLGHEA